MDKTTDRILAVLGLVFAIPAVFEFVHSRKVEEGLLFTAVVFLIVFLLIYRQWINTRELFTFRDIHKTLTFNDATGNLAVLECRFDAKANHTGIQQIWFRNINADGDVTNITIDGQAPAVVQRKAGSWEVCKQFDHAVRSGDKHTIDLRYELLNSFSGNPESITHIVASKTKKLTVRVIFHDKRVGRQIRSFVGRAGAVEEPLNDQPRTIENGNGVEIEIDKPKIGSYFTIEWRW
jgi:hypothetical protein